MADPPAPRAGLYADLLANPSKTSTSGVISAAPVVYSLKTESAEEPTPEPKKRDAALQFNPLRRPQPNKAKTKTTRISFTNKVFKEVPQDEAVPPVATNIEPVKNVDTWTQQTGDDFEQPKPKRPKRSNKEKKQDALARKYDAIYDPQEPNIYREYKGSAEQYDERREWKNLLYRKATGGRVSSKSSTAPPVARNAMFAPPPMETGMSQSPVRKLSATIYNDATGEDAYARRAALAAAGNTNTSSPEPNRPSTSASPAPIPSDAHRRIAELKAKIAKQKADADAAALSLSTSRDVDMKANSTSDLGSTISRAPVAYAQAAEPAEDSGTAGLGATISRAPVVYQQQDTDMPDVDVQPFTQSHAPALKPSKVGIGKRLLEKQGWKAGQGLGANEDGVISHLEAQAGKRKKRSDAEGGGWRGPAVGKITGGERSGGNEEPAQSTVIKALDMLKGLNVKHEIEENDLQQRLGTFFDSNFGNVRRVFIWTADRGGHDEVFIEFVKEISALRAVNPNKPYTFAGNDVSPRFFDAVRFDSGEYDST